MPSGNSTTCAPFSRRVDGLIVVGDKTDPRPSLGHDLPVPVVYAYAPSDDPSDISIVSDNVEAGRMAADHLVSIERRRIAYITGDVTCLAVRDRVDGAVAALGDHNLALVGEAAV